LRVGTVFAVISFLLFFLSIYFGLLPLSVKVDEKLRAQLLALATSFFVGGMVISVLFTVAKIGGRLFSEKVESFISHTMIVCEREID
jgi:hypothetical protein